MTTNPYRRGMEDFSMLFFDPEPTIENFAEAADEHNPYPPDTQEWHRWRDGMAQAFQSWLNEGCF